MPIEQRAHWFQKVIHISRIFFHFLVTQVTKSTPAIKYLVIGIL